MAQLARVRAHHRRRRLHRQRAGAAVAGARVGGGRQSRQAHLRRTAGVAGRSRRPPAASCWSRATWPTRRWCASCSPSIGRGPCSTWRRRRTSTDRSTSRRSSPAPMCWERARCSTRRRATGRGSTRRRASSFRFLLVSTDEVFGSAAPGETFTADSPLAAQLALRRVEGGRRALGARVRPHLRLAGGHGEPDEQLRPAADAGEADPADDPRRGAARAAAALRRRSARARLAARRRLLPCDSGRAVPAGRRGGVIWRAADNALPNLRVVEQICDLVDERLADGGGRRQLIRPRGGPARARSALRRRLTPAAATNWAGGHKSNSHAACATRWRGISTIRSGWPRRKRRSNDATSVP